MKYFLQFGTLLIGLTVCLSMVLEKENTRSIVLLQGGTSLTSALKRFTTRIWLIFSITILVLHLVGISHQISRVFIFLE